MSVSLLLEMAQDAALAEPDRIALVDGDLRLTIAELNTLADGAAGVISASGAQHVAYVGAGAGALSIGSAPLAIKEAKPLPAGD